MLPRRTFHSGWWPIAIGLSLIVILCLLLAANSASAQRPNEQPDRSAASPTTSLPIPKLPVGVGAPAINGSCDDAGYTSGITLTFADQGGATGLVHLVHDDNNLYVCLTGAKGTNNKRLAGVYL